MVRHVSMGTTADLDQVLEFEQEVRKSLVTPAAVLGFSQNFAGNEPVEESPAL